ncbi:hypothetical protein GpartN1_g6037.t1 [Galdieria partita]|uniref:Myb domain-containing protein n=1 Tax=Galdieria partita TaxID=83374 RepID=A0A9C7USP5_9RHOD|nr:hypothetical protein GpartN1_g6037.t1 [Galdieria partita]
MLSSRSRVKKKRRQQLIKENAFSPEQAQEVEEVKSSLSTESIQNDFVKSSDVASSCFKFNENESFEVAGIPQLVFEQQRKRIEQLEKDLKETKIEIEKLRMYNRQLALGLTSLHRQGIKCPNCSTLSSSFSNFQPETSDHRIEKSVFGDVISTKASGHTLNDDECTPASNVLNPSQEGSLEATSKVERKSQSRYWTADEHKRFLEGLARFGHKDMKAIARFVGTRNATQVRTHAQKYYLKLAREAAKRQAIQYNQRASISIQQQGNTDPVYENTDASLISMRYRNSDDLSFSVDSFESSILNPRGLSSTHLNKVDLRDENETSSDGMFKSATLHRASFAQDSSIGEFSTTSEGLSERISVSNNDLSLNSFYDLEGTDIVSDREGNTCINGWLHRDGSGTERNGDYWSANLGSFPMEDSEHSWNILEKLHEKDFSKVEDFRKFPENTI